MDYNIRHGRTLYVRQKRRRLSVRIRLELHEIQYANLRTSSTSADSRGKITISVDVTTQARAMAERSGGVLRAGHLGSKVDRPARELKGFRPVNIPRGQTATISAP